MAPLLDTPIAPLSTLPTDLESILSVEDLPTVLCSTNAIIGSTHTPATLLLSPVTGKLLRVYPTVIPVSSFPPGTPYTDYSPLYLLPGLVDAHVHLNEPGRTEWEGFETGTRAAAFGGVTTLIDMPLNAIPPTTTVENFQTKLKAAEGQCWVDVGFYGGVIPGNAKDLLPLVEAGVKGFKCFLIESGVDEFPMVTAADVGAAMAELKNAPTTLMFHAEMLPPLSLSVGDAVTHGEPPAAPTGALDKYSTFLASRPPAFETYAIEEILALAPTAPQLPLHIVHLSAAAGIPLVQKAREAGIKLTAETCFHYLALTAEEIADGDTRHKCCPPIRGAMNREALWDALKDGTISTVVSDHSPCTAGLKLLTTDETAGDKAGDFFAAWGGISTVGLGLSVLWTGARERGVTLQDVVRWCCWKTAEQVGLLGRKGALVQGWDADVCVFDPAEEWVVQREDMKFKNKVSPYETRKLVGRVRETWLRGRKIYDSQDGFAEKTGPVGELLLEKRQHPN